ncbi:hypothetical protein ACHAXT_004006 [Thalassiosira profunda]
MVRLQCVAASPHLEPFLELLSTSMGAGSGWMYQPEGPRLPWSQAPVPGDVSAGDGSLGGALALLGTWETRLATSLLKMAST